MNFTTIHLQAAFVVAALFLLVPAAAAVEYTVRLLSPDNNGLSYVASAISNDRQIGTRYTSSNQPQAVMWINGEVDPIELNPSAYSYTSGLGMYGNTQVGYGFDGVALRALRWSGTAESVVDLHPVGFQDSLAEAAGQSRQVGVAWNDSYTVRHAILWNGTAASAVDLHPDDWNWSHAIGVSGDKQVGWAGGRGGDIHAMLWSGSPEDVVDLNPPGALMSWATGIHGASQVGYVNFPVPNMPGQHNTHAVVWHGTAESAVNLNPVGYGTSQALAVAGEYQVGFGTRLEGLVNTEMALLWKGSSDSVVNLHDYLSQLGITFTMSQAMGVNERGEVVGIAQDSSNIRRSVVWSPVVPEPSTVLLAIGALLLNGYRSRRCRFVE